MLGRILPAILASVVALATTAGSTQDAAGGWDPPAETQPLLTIRAQAGRGEMSGSIGLDQQEYRGLVLTPTFDASGDLCPGSVRFGFDPSTLDHAPAAWHIEGKLVQLRQGEATVDLRWKRSVHRDDLRPDDAFSGQQRIVLRQGDSRVLDIVRTTKPTATRCDSFAVSYELRFEGPAPLAGAAIAYDLWLVQRDSDGELVTDRYQVTAKQGQQVEYFFRPVSYTGDGRRSSRDAAAILMNVFGTVRGRVRTDGNIDLTVDGARWFANAASSAAVGNQGRTMLTVHPDETIEVATNLPSGGLGELGDMNQVFAKHQTAIRITARRVW